MDSDALCDFTLEQPTAGFEMCISLRLSAFPEEQSSDIYREERLKAAVDRAIDATIDIRVDALRDLGDFFQSRQNFEQYEATLLAIMRLRASQRSDIVLSATDSLFRFYSSHPPHYKTEVISIIDTLISDFTFSEKFLWKLREMKIRFFRCWGDIQSADVLHLDLISETKDRDIEEWKSLNLALANDLFKRKNRQEAKELYWSVFMKMREIQAKTTVIFEALDKFISCNIKYLPSPITTNSIHKSRLLEASMYLQSQVPPFYQSILCEFLSPSNHSIADSEVSSIDSFLCCVLRILPDFKDLSYWPFYSLVRSFESRRGTKKETLIKLLLIAANLASTSAKTCLNLHLLAISRAQEALKDFQAAEVFLHHYFCAWNYANSRSSAVYRKPAPSDFYGAVRKLYSK